MGVGIFYLAVLNNVSVKVIRVLLSH